MKKQSIAKSDYFEATPCVLYSKNKLENFEKKFVLTL